jgi:hypothetical protein
MLIEVGTNVFVLLQQNAFELFFAFRPGFSCHDPPYASRKLQFGREEVAKGLGGSPY